MNVDAIAVVATIDRVGFTKGRLYTAVPSLEWTSGYSFVEDDDGDPRALFWDCVRRATPADLRPRLQIDEAVASLQALGMSAADTDKVRKYLSPGFSPFALRGAGILQSGFVWRDTAEGWAYWRDAYDRLVEASA